MSIEELVNAAMIKTETSKKLAAFFKDINLTLVHRGNEFSSVARFNKEDQMYYIETTYQDGSIESGDYFSWEIDAVVSAIVWLKNDLRCWVIK